MEWVNVDVSQQSCMVHVTLIDLLDMIPTYVHYQLHASLRRRKIWDDYSACLEYSQKAFCR